jgi:hypothetical protein
MFWHQKICFFHLCDFGLDPCSACESFSSTNILKILFSFKIYYKNLDLSFNKKFIKIYCLSPLLSHVGLQVWNNDHLPNDQCGVMRAMK